MIIHTVMDHDIIWGNSNTFANKPRSEIEYNGVLLEVEELDKKGYMINRIISTRLDDFLNPELQPGALIKLYLRSNS